MGTWDAKPFGTLSLNSTPSLDKVRWMAIPSHHTFASLTIDCNYCNGLPHAIRALSIWRSILFTNKCEWSTSWMSLSLYWLILLLFMFLETSNCHTSLNSRWMRLVAWNIELVESVEVCRRHRPSARTGTFVGLLGTWTEPSWTW